MPTNNVTSFESFSKTFINNFFYDQNYRSAWTEDGYQRLRTYLGSVAKGNSTVYTAPFAKGETMQQILADWNKELVSISDAWPTLYQFEEDLARKVGPMSIELPLRERMDDIAHYYYDILLSSTPIDSRAIKSVIGEWSRARGLRMRGQSQTVDLMKKSTNSGSPYFTKRREALRDTIPCTVNKSLNSTDVWQKLRSQWFDAPAVIGWRGQEGGPSPEDVKQRVVWMFPFAANIVELQVYQPLIEAGQRFNLVPAWVGMDAVDREITNLFDTKRREDLVVCTDFTRFDQHFNAHMQMAGKTILKGLLSNGQSEFDWLELVYPIKYSIPLAWEVNDKEVLDIHVQDVTYFSGLHGMASGSGGTNADETLVHRALQYEAAIRAGSRLNPHSMCLGDDGVLTFPGITVDGVIEAYQSHGQECNSSKQYASTDDCVYLRRWHHRLYRKEGVCVGVYSTNRALGRLRYLERFMNPELWSKEAVALRQLSIIENVKWHPLRERFADFCMKRDRYRLGKDIPGFLDNLTRYVEKSIDLMPDFLGYTKTQQGFEPSGINEWWIVNYLKSVQ